MFSNGEEDDAVLHPPLNLFRGCDVMESAAAVFSPTPISF